MPIRSVLAALVAFAGPLVAERSASAWNASKTASGAPVRWFARNVPLPYHLGAIRPEELSPEIAQAVIQTAWDTWAHAGCEDVPSGFFAGTTEDTAATRPKTLRSAPDNLVVFVRTIGEWEALGRGSTEIATTFVAANDKTGEIIDADIVVNDARWRLTIGGGVAGEVDFVSVMTHEVGHVMGFEHASDASATMFATYNLEDPLGARSLSPDDLSGLCAIYADVPDHLSGRRVEGCSGASDPTLPALLGLAGLALVGRRWQRRRPRVSMESP